MNLLYDNTKQPNLMSLFYFTMYKNISLNEILFSIESFKKDDIKSYIVINIVENGFNIFNTDRKEEYINFKNEGAFAFVEGKIDLENFKKEFKKLYNQVVNIYLIDEKGNKYVYIEFKGVISNFGFDIIYILGSGNKLPFFLIFFKIYYYVKFYFYNHIVNFDLYLFESDDF